jgi:acetolactate synthase-1/2/3 large subunit
MKLTGAEIIWECLQKEGVDVVFGYPGGAILPTYDAMTKYPKIHHVLVRHEQGATHMADGYARASGKVGVAIATSGPGATNMVTGIATAMMDSSPIVCITGQVGSKAIGTDAFQETDVTGVTLPVTKHNYLVTKPGDIARAIREAFYIAKSGRPGPVLVDITKDAQQLTAEFDWEAAAPRLPGYRPSYHAPASEFARAAELINSAKRPLILAGQGIIKSGTTAEVLKLAKTAGIPITTTLLGIGAIPASSELNLGMMGMHGEAWVNQAIQQADLLIALGMRFDDRVTGNLKTYALNAKKIHVDIDPTEINKNVPVDVALIGDLREVLTVIQPQIKKADHAEWWSAIAGTAATRPCATSRACPTAATSTPRMSSTTSGASRRSATPSSSPTSASTRCGRPSISAMTSPARSSPRAALARWASHSPPPSGPSSPARTKTCGWSSATAASR